MATKKKKSGSRRTTKKMQQAKNQLMAVVMFTVGLLFFFLSVIGGSEGWLKAHNFLLGCFGAASFFIGPLFIYIAVMASLEKLAKDMKPRSVLGVITLLLISAACQIFFAVPIEAQTAWGTVKEVFAQGITLKGGGVASLLFGIPMLKLGDSGAKIVVSLLIFAFLMIITKSTIAGMLRGAKKPVQRIADSCQEFVAAIPAQINREVRKSDFDISIDDVAPTVRKRGKKIELVDPVVVEGSKNAKLIETATQLANGTDLVSVPMQAPITPMVEQPVCQVDSDIDDIIKRVAGTIDAVHAEKSMAQAMAEAIEGMEGIEKVDTDDLKVEMDTQLESPPIPQYVMPPINLLREASAPIGGNTNEELKQNAQLLVDTLQSFGVQTRIVDISRGPAVTRYELQPSAGVKISKITNLADDIALNLAAAGVRIEAPIPNKAAVGIEIPNKVVTAVTLREVIDSKDWENAKSNVSIALGKDVSGQLCIADIAKMPHLLIAGATGSGKSVCINSIIMSILYKAKPDEVKLMLVDPKVVELGVYNGLPHLVVPVVSDAKKAAGVLGWAVSEMLKRYQIFAQHSTRDITSFNKIAENNELLEKMPHIVIVVDELADLMMAAPADVEDHICRLAQMARAAGMHLIIATQRPSVDVITGVIKANIPSRIAFAVSSQVDSRTILDMGGAEKLLGKGDMLFYPMGASKPVRIQGCFVSDDEIERVVSFIKSAQNPEYDQQVLDDIEKHIPVKKGSSGAYGSDGSGGENSDEAMINQAIECVVEAGIASTSLLQRRCKLGYARAARIIDELEARGIVGPFEGSKPRQVLISKDRWIEMKLNNANGEN